VRTERQETLLPGSGERGAVVCTDVDGEVFVVVRVGDRLCTAHPDWMTAAAAREWAAQVFELAAEGTGAA
jgi:hypothetical protein